MIRGEITEKPKEKKYVTRHEKFFEENKDKVIVQTNRWDSVSDWCYTFYNRVQIGIEPKDMLMMLMNHLGLCPFAAKFDPERDKDTPLIRLVVIDGQMYKIQFLSKEEFEKRRNENKPAETVVRSANAETNKQKIIAEMVRW